MDQCFIGALLRFGFRIHSPCRTASQISRESPFRLKNILNNRRKSTRAGYPPEKFPSLLACQILPCSSSEESPTVFQVLNEYLQLLQRRTPDSLSRSSSQPSPLSQASYEAFLAARRASLQQTKASPIYCTPHDFGSMITPLALTGSTQPSSGSVPTQGSVQGSHTQGRRKSDQAFQDLDDPDKAMNSTHCPPCVIQSLTPAILKPGEPNTETVDDFTEQHFSHEWTDYDDFSSSEDLTAFLADLEWDALGKEDGQTIPSLLSMATGIATLKDVVCEMTRASNVEDFTEFSDFPSSEDLDAFLADMELDCENMPMRKSPTLRSTATSAAFMNSKLHGKIEGSKCLAIKGHVVHDIENACNTKISSESFENKVQTSSDMGHGGDSFSAEEEVRLFCSSSSFSDKMHGSDCSDSQLLRDCGSVFADMTENMRSEGRALGTSSPLIKINLSRQGRSVSQNSREDMNNLSTRRSKPFCRSRSTRELHEKDIVGNTPLRNEQTEIKRSRDDHNANESDESRQGDRWTSMDLHGNSGVSMLTDSCDMMTSTPFSPDLFSQSSVVDGCSKKADPFSSPRLVEGKMRSCCTHGSATPDLFSPPTSFTDHARSCTKEELHSVLLFSSSECSPLAVCENEAASLSSVSHCDTENEFNRSSLLVNLHSTPYGVCIPSRMLSKPWTPIQVSPLVASTGSKRCNDINLQGTPVLFSQYSNSSL